MGDISRIQELLQKLFSKTASSEEVEELHQLVDPQHQEKLYQHMAGAWENTDSVHVLPNSALREIAVAITGKYQSKKEHLPAPVHRIHFLRTAWFRVAVAVLIILTGFFLYNEFLHTSKTGKEIAVKPSPQPDIFPGSSKAILTLSDGSKIELNNAASETITDGNLSIANTNGQLIYSDAERGSLSPTGGSTLREAKGEGGPVSSNTMTTPRGGTYQLILPDGSRVWLNAESSITFPTAFTQNRREVKITGEAYFEIKPNPATPFIVKTISDEIQVLGTSFNINAYNDAPVKTSLLEGSIKVNTTILKPGFAYQDKKIYSTNMEQDIAWKKGVFNFKNLPAEAALKQLARWYDIDIKYENGIPGTTLGGEMGRNLSLQQVLKGLEGVIAHFRLQGKTLYVNSL